MTVSTTSVVRFLNNLLNVRDIADLSKNGLQVRGSNTVKKIGVAVDGCEDVFKLAKKNKCDFIIVHHGLLWKGTRDYTGLKKKNIRYLKDQGISLYAAHLPLDLHRKYGNNVLLAELLNLQNIKKFGRYHKKNIGYVGTLPKKNTIQGLAKTLNKILDTFSTNLPFGKKYVSTIGIVSGGGSSALPEAYLKKIDCLVTGEAPHNIHHEAKQLKMNVILAGHYETETLGVKALGKLLAKKYGLPHKFLHIPTII